MIDDAECLTLLRQLAVKGFENLFTAKLAGGLDYRFPAGLRWV